LCGPLRWESFVDAASIDVTPDARRAKWRIVRWVSEAFRDKYPLPPNGVSYVIVVSTFDRSKELMPDEQTTMYLADGTNKRERVRKLASAQQSSQFAGQQLSALGSRGPSGEKSNDDQYHANDDEGVYSRKSHLQGQPQNEPEGDQ
jgi:hypothetical protein